MIALYTVLAVLVAIIVLVIVLLSISITYSLECEAQENYRISFHVDWMGKLFKMHLNWFSNKEMENVLFVGGKSIKKGIFDDKEEQKQTEDNVTDKENPKELIEEIIEESPEESIDELILIESSIEEADKEAKAAEENKPADETNEQKKSKKIEKEDLYWLLKRLCSKDFLAALLKMLRSIYQHTKPRTLEIEGVLGTGDPAYTGILQGFLYSQWAEAWSNVSFEYLDSECKGRFYMKGRVRLINMAWYGIRFALSKPVREIIAYMTKAIRKGGVQNG